MSSNRSCFLTIRVDTELPQLPVSTHLQWKTEDDELIQSGLMGDIVDDKFSIVDDPIRSIERLLLAVERPCDAIYVTTSTCSWTPDEAIWLNAMLQTYLVRGGNTRFFSGKGCNTLSDAVVVAHESIIAGCSDHILILNIDQLRSARRLQNYAFFSDIALVLIMSNDGGDYRMAHGLSCMAAYSPDRFANSNCLQHSLPSTGTGIQFNVHTLNTYDFVLRFKYGNAPVYRSIRRPRFKCHHFGADPFLSLTEVPSSHHNLIHVESPPGHVTQLVFR